KIPCLKKIWYLDFQNGTTQFLLWETGSKSAPIKADFYGQSVATKSIFGLNRLWRWRFDNLSVFITLIFAMYVKRENTLNTTLV
ncbi:MAG: hypothetical protein ACXVB4_18825, partial [Pseudobdellovibrionaceae bacterium]